MIRFYATTSVKLLETNDELIAKQKFELVPFDELKYLADKNTTLIGNFDYTFILKIYLYTIIFIILINHFIVCRCNRRNRRNFSHGKDRGAWEKIE